MLSVWHYAGLAPQYQVIERKKKKKKDFNYSNHWQWRQGSTVQFSLRVLFNYRETFQTLVSLGLAKQRSFTFILVPGPTKNRNKSYKPVGLLRVLTALQLQDTMGMCVGGGALSKQVRAARSPCCSNINSSLNSSFPPFPLLPENAHPPVHSWGLSRCCFASVPSFPPSPQSCLRWVFLSGFEWEACNASLPCLHCKAGH